jgi:acyl-coenzyme A thioesterase PaaI-like protein
MNDSRQDVPAGFEPVHNAGSFAETIGPVYVRDPGGENPVTGLFYDPGKHGNPMGRMHGGVMMSVLDQHMGMIAFRHSGGQPIASISLDYDFVSGVRERSWIEFTGELTRAAPQAIFVRGEVTANGRILMTGAGIWMVVKPKG